MRILRVIRDFCKSVKNHVFLEVTSRIPAFLRQHLGLQAPHFYDKINPPPPSGQASGIGPKGRPDKENPRPTPLPGITWTQTNKETQF